MNNTLELAYHDGRLRRAKLYDVTDSRVGDCRNRNPGDPFVAVTLATTGDEELVGFMTPLAAQQLRDQLVAIFKAERQFAQSQAADL